MKLLIVDLETTGLETSEGAQAIELAAILFSVPFRTALQTVSILLPTDENPASHINGIDPIITNLEQPWRTGLAMFREMAAAADYAVAHNSDFDSKFFGVGRLEPLHLQWLCTMTTFSWGDLPGRSLRDLALAHGIAVMPDVHRALPDCHLLASVLSKRDDLEELIAKAAEPRHTYRAVVSFAEKDQAKHRGFRWNPERRAWHRKLTADEANRFRSEGLHLAKVA
jgi:DNA polymerase-3 subunit epsilon